MNNIFVGNLSFEATKEDLVKLFEPFGTVANAVIMERKKHKSRGYGFVDMPNEEEKNAAIAALQGKEFMWRVLSVSLVIPKVKSEVKFKEPRPAKKEWSQPKPYRKDDRAPQPENSSAGSSKYYSKFDGPPKPWRKVNSDSKPSHKKDQGSRPYYGKNDRNSKPGSSSEGAAKPYGKNDRTSRSRGAKPPYKKFEGKTSSLAKKLDGSTTFSNKTSGGFKMLHKVSGASRNRPK